MKTTDKGTAAPARSGATAVGQGGDGGAGEAHAAPRLVCVYNQKGGVGKTTLAVNLAALSAARGARTLLVDSDPQGNATCYLLGENAARSKGLPEFYESCLGLNLFRQGLLEYVTTATGVAGLHLVTADRSLEDLRNKLENKHKIHKLRDGLRSTTYDAVFFDPPPANDFFALACLIAAHEVLVPIDCDSFSVRAARDIQAMVEEVRADHNPSLRITGVVVNQYQKGTRHGGSIVEELRGMGLPLLEPFVPSSVKVRESHSDAVPFVLSAPAHPVSVALRELHEAVFPGPAVPAGTVSGASSESPARGKRAGSKVTLEA